MQDLSRWAWQGEYAVQSRHWPNCVEQVFGWIKHAAGMRQTKLRGRKRVEWMFQLAAAALNLRPL